MPVDLPLFSRKALWSYCQRGVATFAEGVSKFDHYINDHVETKDVQQPMVQFENAQHKAKEDESSSKSVDSESSKSNQSVAISSAKKTDCLEASNPDLLGKDVTLADQETEFLSNSQNSEPSLNHDESKPKGLITGNDLMAEPDRVSAGYQRKVKGDGPCLFAFIIGINTYDGAQSGTASRQRGHPGDDELSNPLPPFSDLRGAVPDARNFRDYLINDLEVPPEHINMLCDEQATREAIIEGFHTLRDDDNVNPGDSIFIFYAGHGAQALPPTRLENIPGCPTKIELLIPYNYRAMPGEHVNMGIPDYTLAALLDQISEKKGKNITVVFDCCHSASGLRGNKRPKPDEPITRSLPELKYRVPDNLDKEIWGLNGKRGVSIPKNLGHLGTSSYVFFSACKSTEEARERENRGCFSTAMLKLLRTAEYTSISCAEIIAHLDHIDGQSPQCEGTQQDTKPIFHSFALSNKPKYYEMKTLDRKAMPKIKSPCGFFLNAGNIHGIGKDDELTIYKNKSEVGHGDPIGVVIVDVVNLSQSYVKFKGATFSLQNNPSPALVTKRAINLKDSGLNLYITTFALISRVKKLPDIHKFINIVSNSDKAHVELSMHKATNQLCFQVVDQVWVQKDIKLPSHFVSNTEEDLSHVLIGLSSYYSHLKRMGDGDVVKDISVSFFMLQDTYDEQPRFTQAKGTTDMYTTNGVVKVDVADSDPEDDKLYGIQVINNSDKGEVLFPVVFYFDNTDFTISRSYQHPFAGSNPESIWPSKGKSLTFGYGYGPGATIPPFTFNVDKVQRIEAGFFKIVFSTKPVDLQNIEQTVSPFIKNRGMKPAVVPDIISDTQHRWGSIDIPVVQRAI